MDLDAFILIGGRASRFGSDKALADLDSVPLAENAARIVRTAFPAAEISFVAANEMQFAAAQFTQDLIFDRRPGIGSWSGVHAALTASKCEFCLILACDLPLINAELLCKLAHAVETSGKHAAVPLQPDGRLQPLCAVYRTRPVLESVEALLAAADRPQSLISFVQGIGAEVVEADDRGLDTFLNVNTPDDLKKAASERARTPHKGLQ